MLLKVSQIQNWMLTGGFEMANTEECPHGKGSPDWCNECKPQNSGVSHQNSDHNFDLTDAYSVETPEDNLDLYARWADTYESSFVSDEGYVYHYGVAAAFLETFISRSKPILDVGCGTGLVGEALCANSSFQSSVEGLDLSSEMLEQARLKKTAAGQPIYRDLHIGDLTTSLNLPDNAYSGVISCGTFSHGHVGPEAFDELYRVAQPGALFAIGINPDHFSNQGFETRFYNDVSSGIITKPVYKKVQVYSTGSHKDEKFPVGIFYLK